MQCPECQVGNREGAKFCKKCGTKLELKCPSCGNPYESDSVFCDECGHNLTLPSKPTPKDLTLDEKIEKIQKYLPKGLIEKILAQRERIEGERKQVTVMFCDMEGFTALSERIGPEEAYSIMDQVYEILIHKVHDYEGTVNEMTGDGIMALFGAPIALEDAPQRAIRSAYAIHREMTRYSDNIKQEIEGIPPLKMRVGIHTGPVVVGTLGNDLRVEFKAVGDTVNLASRMQDLAEPGATYVTENTLKLSEGLFRFEALGEKKIKGKEKPVGAYRVIGPSTRRTRFDVSVERGLTPFVGRDREVELLLDGFERAKAGRGQAFSIIAEAGVGKSRLLYEFRKAVANEDATFLEGKCLSYGRGQAYHPTIDVLQANFNIHEGDPDPDVKEKVRKGLKALGIDEASALPYLFQLFLIKDSSIPRISLSPEGWKDGIIEAITRIVLKGSEIRPLILAFEDLHWADENSEEVMKHVLNSIDGARILIIFTFRPEFVHTWGARSYHSHITLSRLSNRESLTMAAHFLGTKDIDNTLEDLILEKTEGIPFFIEEFIKSLKELKLLEQKDNRCRLTKHFRQVIIPSTIQDVIMARIDSLPQTAKELVQTGSAIEREFSYELINHITGLPERELLFRLSILKDSEIIYERGIFPESIYIFKHSLTREVVYDSILTRRKKKLHNDIGETIEKIYKDKIDEHHGILAGHFTAAEKYEKAAEYSSLAAKKSEKTVYLNDAISHLKKTVDSLEKLTQTDEVQKKIIDARTSLGLYMVQLFYFNQAKQAIEPIIEPALKSGYKRRISQIYSIIGAHNIFVEEKYPDASINLEKALKIAEEMDDVSVFFANVWLGYANAYQCDFEKALYHFQKAHDINVSAHSTWGIAVAKAQLGMVYNFQGRIHLSRETALEALRIAEESNDSYSKAVVNTFYGINCFFKGRFEEAKNRLLKGLGFYERINFYYGLSVSNQHLGLTYSAIGEHEKAREHYQKSIRTLEQINMFPSDVTFTKTCLALTETRRAKKDVQIEYLSGLAVNNKLKLRDGWIRKNIGEILLYSGDEHMAEAGKWIEQAIDEDRKNCTKWNLGMDYACYARLLRRKGNKSKTREMLNNAIDVFRECGADGWVEKYEKELAQL